MGFTDQKFVRAFFILISDFGANNLLISDLGQNVFPDQRFLGQSFTDSLFYGPKLY